MQRDCCHACRDARLADADPMEQMSVMMLLCPECGNKRCPRANHHDHLCTGSNEPGQAGSAYPRVTVREAAGLFAGGAAGVDFLREQRSR